MYQYTIVINLNYKIKMANIVVTNPDGSKKYVKTINQHDEELEFTKNKSEAYDRSSGFYINSEIDFLKFHFKEKYPEIMTAKAVPDYD